MKGGLVTLLNATSTVTDIIGTSKVFISKARQQADPPYVVLVQLESEEFGCLDGGTGDLRKMGFNIDCCSRDGIQAENLGNAVSDLLKDYSGAAGSFTIDAVNFHGEVTTYTDPDDGSDNGLHIVSLDMDFWYRP